MIYEEAIEYITERYVTMSMCLTLDECTKHNKAISMAIEALEKQIPKKPTMGKYGHAECACCGWVVESFCGDLEQYSFCPNCGQAIDWSDDE